MKAFKKWLKNYTKSSALIPSIWVCGLIQLGDILSSLGSFGQEQNPYARDGQGNFWPWHGIVIKLMYLGFYSAISWAIYEATRRYNRHLAETLAAIPFIYFAWSVYEAVITNILIHAGWFYPDVTKGVVLGLFGGQ